MAKSQQQPPEPSKETALAQFVSAYPALAGGGAVAEALAVNLGGEDISVFDLQRIRIPTGGALAWEVPSPTGGDPNYEKEVDGIIVFSKTGRSFWRLPFEESGGGSPPDCSSPDNVQGYGDPGIKCSTCPFAQFGSKEALAQGKIDGLVMRPGAAPRRGGQACRQQRFLFLLREGQTLPTVITLPPTSMKAMKQWLIQISQQGRPYWSYLVRMTLVRATNKDNIGYAQVRVSVLRELTSDEVVAVQNFAAKTRETFAQYREGLPTAGDEEMDDDLGNEELDGEEAEELGAEAAL